MKIDSRLSMIVLSMPLFLTSAPLQADEAQEAPPVRTVTLFSSGVGYFQHEGSIIADQPIRLQFNSRQINDLLKSLVPEDLDKGSTATLEYPTRDPIAKVLDEFRINLNGNPALSDLLEQLRGTRITVEFHGERLTGTLLGVEKRPLLLEEQGNPVEDWMITLADGGKLRALPLREVRELELQDVALREELNKAMSALDQGRGKEKKTVTLRFNGSGPRHIRLGYVMETPVWKSSYRLLMPGKEENGRLQGWAVVENQTDQDWRDIRLSLISGRPIAFTQDLYQPLYAPRPEVKPRQFAGLTPGLHEGGIQNDAFAPEAPPVPAGGGGPRKTRSMLLETGMATAKSASMGQPRGTQSPGEEEGIDADTLVAAATAGEVGSFFRFTMENVDLPRHRSAMIAFAADPIQVKKVSIYNARTLASHPLLGSWLENTTGKFLPAGPVTLFDGGIYAGDGQMEDLPPGQKRMISYAVDLDLQVIPTEGKSETMIVSGKLVQGVLQVSKELRRHWNYRMKNNGEKERTLVIEHPLHVGWQILSDPKPVESTATLHRFSQSLPPGATLDFAVEEGQKQVEKMVLLESSSATLFSYAQNGNMSKPVQEALAKAAQMQQKVGEIQQQIRVGEKWLEEQRKEEETIRANLAAVATGSPYKEQLTHKLMERDKEREQRRNTLENLRKQYEEQHKQLTDHLNGLNIP